MTQLSWPTGLLTALVTPFKDDQLDVSAARLLVDRQIADGASGLVVAGGTGEYGTLTVGERKTLAESIVEHVAGRVPVIVQTGALATRDTLDLSRHAQDLGAFGLLVASPFGEPINWQERKCFYEQVNDSVDLPIMVYNTPPAGLLTFAEILELAALRNVSAVKDSSGSTDLLGDLLDWADGTDFTVYVGWDGLLAQAITAGAAGVVFGAASFLCAEMTATIASLRDPAAHEHAKRQWRALWSMLRFMELSSNYVALCKAGCTVNGVDVGNVRAPYIMSSQEEISDLAQRLDKLHAEFGTSRWT